MLLNKAESLITAIIAKIGKTTKPTQKFINHILILFMGLRGKYNFINMARYGSYTEQTYRNQMSKPFDWAGFNKNLIQQNCSGELILAFDPSYLPKSGKKTAHVGRFWSGKDQAVKLGIEIGSIAVVDVQNGTALSLEAVQTPKIAKNETGESVVDHYAQVILDKLPVILSLHIRYVAVDAFFSKNRFIDAITSQSPLEIVGRLRNDANLRYQFTGKQNTGRGRKRKYGNKVDVERIDWRKIRFCFDEADDVQIFSGIVYCVSLQRLIRIVYLQNYDQQGYATSHSIFFSTDLNLRPEKILQYYRQRYQIEFLFRDAKNFAGLEDCQARSESKLHFHVNASLSSVSLAKALHYLNVPKEERDSFSMTDVKVMYFNQFITDFIFSKLALDMSCEKYKSLYNECLSIGRLAA
jgi:Transposase DDE domain